jgi:hypothetical protein
VSWPAVGELLARRPGAALAAELAAVGELLAAVGELLATVQARS